jgi:flagellum-specific ATP synthase
VAIEMTLPKPDTTNVHMPTLEPHLRRLMQSQPWRWQGQVLQAVGQTIESAGPNSSVGECCEIIDRNGRPHLAEVIGFRGATVLSMPVESPEGIRFGDRVEALGTAPEIAVGTELLGRVLDGLGKPIDEKRRRRPPTAAASLPLDGPVRLPLTRLPIRDPIGTGIRALDALLTVGRGQRVGIFGGSGVGKSTLIGMMTRNTSADVTVVGLADTDRSSASGLAWKACSHGPKRRSPKRARGRERVREIHAE